jgi:hypothetical protein
VRAAFALRLVAAGSLAGLLLLATACSREVAPAPDPRIHAVTMPDLAEPELPDAPGRAVLVGACSTCHTLRYVLDQPPLPRRTWAAEVDKMRKVYHAPFPEEMSAPIVDYLVAVRGTEG